MKSPLSNTEAEKPVLQNTEQFLDEEVQLAVAADELQVEENEAIDADSEEQTPQYFANMERAAMVEIFAKMLVEKPVAELRQAAEQFKIAFYKKHKQEAEILRKAFEEQENPEEEEFVLPNDGLEQKLKDLFAQYRKLRAEYTRKIEQEREKNLQQKLGLIEELKGLLDRQDDFNAVFNDFKALQQRWREIGAVPQEKQNDLWRTYNHNVEKFYDMVKITKELRALDFKKNMELKQSLCEKAEELLQKENVVAAFKILQKYHEQWREIGPVAKEQREAIWDRFKAATTQINKKHSDYFEQQKQIQQNNLALKEKLCKEAETLSGKPCLEVKDWNESTNLLIEAQKTWKTIGLAPIKENEKVYQRFRKVCDTFFENRKAFFGKIKTEYTENLQRKIAFCEKAEALSTSEQWMKVSDELAALQRKWKKIGIIPRKYSDALWVRFKTACDAFFEHKKNFFIAQAARFEENLQKKEKLIEEIRAHKAGEDAEANLALAKEWQRRWRDIGYVPMQEKERLRNAYLETLGTACRTMKIDKREYPSPYETLVKKDETGKVDKASLIQQIKTLEADIQLWENNIGFFAKSKNAEKLIAEVRNNIDKAKEEVEFLKGKLQTLRTQYVGKKGK